MKADLCFFCGMRRERGEFLWGDGWKPICGVCYQRSSRVASEAQTTELARIMEKHTRGPRKRKYK